MQTVIVNLRSPRVLVAVSVGAILVLLIVGLWRYMNPPPTVSAPYLASLIWIRKLVVYPDTAIYSKLYSDPAATVHLRKDGDYETTGWVEEEDKSGRRVHLDWRCVVHPQSGDHWMPVYARLGHLTVGIDPDAK